MPSKNERAVVECIKVVFGVFALVSAVSAMLHLVSNNFYLEISENKSVTVIAYLLASLYGLMFSLLLEIRINKRITAATINVFYDITFRSWAAQYVHGEENIYRLGKTPEKAVVKLMLAFKKLKKPHESNEYYIVQHQLQNL